MSNIESLLQISPNQLKVYMQNNYTQLIVIGPSSLAYSRLYFYNPKTDSISSKATYLACYSTPSECKVGYITQDLDNMASPNRGIFYDNGNGKAIAYLDLLGQLVSTDNKNFESLCFVIAPNGMPENYNPNVIIQLTGITAYPRGNCSDIGCKGTVKIQFVKRCLWPTQNTDNNYTPCNQRKIIKCVPLNYNCICPYIKNNKEINYNIDKNPINTTINQSNEKSLSNITIISQIMSFINQYKYYLISIIVIIIILALIIRKKE